MKNSEKQEEVFKMRHTLSHVMAAAVKELYPTIQFGIGPAIDDGFYYDMEFGDTKITEEDLAKIEKKMRGISQRKFTMVRSEKSRDEALSWAIAEKQPLKKELIEELPESEPISFYAVTAPDGTVVFEDLCKGPHVDNSAELGYFKLTRVAGAYWRGDEKRQMLTRIYGVAFATEE